MPTAKIHNSNDVVAVVIDDRRQRRRLTWAHADFNNDIYGYLILVLCTCAPASAYLKIAHIVHTTSVFHVCNMNLINFAICLGFLDFKCVWPLSGDIIEYMQADKKINGYNLTQPRNIICRLNMLCAQTNE